jgi:hypothetical protein
MARVLIVGGEGRGRRLAAALLQAGLAVRIVVAESSRAHDVGLERVERFEGDAERPGTLKAALEQVSVACWLFGDADADPARVRALHGARLERFLEAVVDSSVRGLVYEAAGGVDPRTLGEGRELVTRFALRNAIPLALIDADPASQAAWLAQLREAVAALLERYPSHNPIKLDRVSP